MYNATRSPVLNVFTLQDVREFADFGVQLLICKSARFAGFAFPDQRGFIATPGRQVTIETVVRDVDLAADEPFCVRWVPLQHCVPLFEPVKFFRHARPESFGIRACLGAQRFEFSFGFDVCLGGEFGRWREDSFFLKN